MIIKCDGIIIGKFRIPPFELKQGELIGIFLYNGEHSFDLKMELVTYFTGKKNINGLKVFENLKFVEHFSESKIKRIFKPTSVEEYLKMNFNFNSEEIKKVYEIDKYIKPKTKIQSLAGTPRKLLSLYSTLSNTNKVVFDLAGIDPLGADKILDTVLESVNQGGAAILLDSFDDSEQRCTKFIRVELIE
jgi:ABC-type multidrug transport system ATPase subunit